MQCLFCAFYSTLHKFLQKCGTGLAIDLRRLWTVGPGKALPFGKKDGVKIRRSFWKSPSGYHKGVRIFEKFGGISKSWEVV